MRGVEVSLCAALQGFEEELLNPGVRRDKGRLMELLAEEFREFGSSGRIFTRQQMIEALAEEQSRAIGLKDFVAERLADQCVLVTYRAHKVVGGLRMQETLRCSIWMERAGRWQMVFHQGTKAEQ